MESAIHRVHDSGLEKEDIFGWDEGSLLSEIRNKIHPPGSLGLALNCLQF